MEMEIEKLKLLICMPKVYISKELREGTKL
jgi:hypothetical protein